MGVPSAAAGEASSHLSAVAARPRAAAAAVAAAASTSGTSSEPGAAAGNSEVEIILYCTGDMLTLHEYCSKFVAYAEQRVLMLLGSKPNSGSSWVNLTIVPSGSIVQLPGPGGATLPTPVCAGGGQNASCTRTASVVKLPNRASVLCNALHASIGARTLKVAGVACFTTEL